MAKIDTARPSFVVELTLSDGTKKRRQITVGQALSHEKTVNLDAIREVPRWAINPRRSWPHPQDPITLSARVEIGHDQEALAWLDEIFGPEEEAQPA